MEILSPRICCQFSRPERVEEYVERTSQLRNKVVQTQMSLKNGSVMGEIDLWNVDFSDTLSTTLLI